MLKRSQVLPPESSDKRPKSLYKPVGECGKRPEENVKTACNFELLVKPFLVYNTNTQIREKYQLPLVSL